MLTQHFSLLVKILKTLKKETSFLQIPI